MSKYAVEQRPDNDIFHDHNPFILDTYIPYVQIDQVLAGPRDFSVIPQGYYDLIWDGLNNDGYFVRSMFNSSFLHKFMDEIINRFCHESVYIVKIELQPRSYKDITKDQIIPYISWWFNYAIETCRYGELCERMIDTVTREDIDIFLENIIDLCANRLLLYVTNS